LLEILLILLQNLVALEQSLCPLLGLTGKVVNLFFNNAVSHRH
jgi:hypothetical protein